MSLRYSRVPLIRYGRCPSFEMNYPWLVGLDVESARDEIRSHVPSVSIILAFRTERKKKHKTSRSVDFNGRMIGVDVRTLIEDRITLA